MLLGAGDTAAPHLSGGGGAEGTKAALLIILHMPGPASTFIFYTLRGVLHSLAIGKRKRESPATARGVSSLCKS